MHEVKGIVVITGAGLKAASMTFKTGIPATIIEHEGHPHKMNASAGVAKVLSSEYRCVVTGYDDGHLETIRGQMQGEHETLTLDLKLKNDAERLADRVSTLKTQTGLPVHVVHYGGASDTPTELPWNSVFGHCRDMPGEAIPHLVANNCTTMLHLFQALDKKGIFHTQSVTKFILVSAITSLRTKLCHAIDAAQKGAGHALARSMALDLTPEGIYITEIMPGITDTGFYDNPRTLEFLLTSSAAMGYSWTSDTVPVFTAEVIGEAVQYVLNARAHIRELSLMPFGQYPQLGA